MADRTIMQGGQTLADQIRAMGGNWNIQGIDRAQELADILTTNGITDLSQLRMNQGTMQQMNGSGENPADPTTVGNNTMSYGDRTFGTLARQGTDPAANMTANEGENVLARSVAGKGAVTYQATTGPDGKVSIQPVWRSSGSEDALKAVATLAALGTGVGMAGGAGLLGTGAQAASAGTIFGAGGALGGFAAPAGGQALSAGGYGALADMGGSEALTGGLLGGGQFAAPAGVAGAAAVPATSGTFSGFGGEAFTPGGGLTGAFSSEAPVGSMASQFGGDAGLLNPLMSSGTAPLTLADALKKGGSGLAEWAKANPDKAIQAGALVSGLIKDKLNPQDGSSYTGAMPTISRGGWSATASPTYMPNQAQKTGLLSLPTTGNVNSGLWRYAGLLGK
jgi:hypothetical protein